MLTRTIYELQNIVKTSDAESASEAAHILSAIRDNKPDTILLKHQKELYKYYDKYSLYSQFNLDKLKQELEDINNKPAIDTLIVLSLIGNFKKQSKVKWQKPLGTGFVHWDNIYSEILEASSKELSKFVGAWKTDYYIPLISEWAAQNRYLPPGTTEYPGYVDHAIAPHVVEIQDCLHPDSGISQVSIMKSTQSLATTTIENAIGHSIKYKLHNILYIISSKNIAGIRSSSAIDVMIDHSGLAEYVKPISQRMKRKVADNKYYKEFHGGRRLMMTSWHSIGDAKSLTWSLIIMDEIDEAPYELAGQGDPEAIFAGRGKTIRNLKIVKLGTPTTVEGRIYRNFLEGDQRYYFVQCQFCGGMQILELKGLGRDYGLTARSEKISGIEQIIPDTVRYICKHCKKEHYEYQKGAMLKNGIWKPTARPVNPAYRSYQISNLMSPVMFYTWTKVMQEFCETEWGAKITKFKNFVIDVLGMPWESRSNRKTWIEVKQRAEDYELGQVQGGYIITAGADIQKNRIELQAVAWGHEMESWVIDYQTFWGETKDKKSLVWQNLRNFIMTKKYKMGNKMIPIALTAIDTGYNPLDERIDSDTDIQTEHIVYEFVATTPRTIACRGNDKMKDAIIKEEKVKRRSLLKRRYDVAVSELKEELYTKLELRSGDAGYIHFSNRLSDDYFKGLMAEVYAEILPGKWNWKKIWERNEMLDNYILARAAAEFLGLPQWNSNVWDDLKKRINAM